MRRRDLLDLVRGLWLAVGVAAALMIVSTVAAAVAVLLAGRTVTALGDGADARSLAFSALAAGIIGSAAWSGSDLLIARFATTIAVRLRAVMVRHMLSLPIGFFTDRSVGEVTDRISTDVDTVATGVVNQLKPIAMGALGATVALLLSMTVDLRLTVLFIPAAAGIVWSGRASGRRVAETSRELQAEWAEAAGTAEEAFGAREDLRQALGRGLIMRRWAEHGGRIWSHATDLGRARNLLTISTIGMLRTFQLVVLVAGSVLAVRGEIAAGGVVAAFGLVTIFSRRIEDVLNNLPKVSDLVAASQRIVELLDEEPEAARTASPSAPLLVGAHGANAAEIADGVAPDPVRWQQPVAITFDDVSFAYGDGPEVLHHVTFGVRPGRSLAVVGRTGSGKSTVVRLINRAVLTPVGSVFVDGVDVCAIELEELRRHVGVVSQRVELLRASLHDNVTLFDPSISTDTVRAAFDQLGLTHWLADLPDGLDTVLGDSGSVLSAGEEQLVAFARLLVRNPSVVVLDEATARLDPGTEALLQAATDRLLAGRTSIIIAHRLATIAGVDDVVVLDAGRVVEHGGRRQLLEQDDSVFGALVEAAGGIHVREVIEPHAHRARPRTRTGDIDDAFDAAAGIDVGAEGPGAGAAAPDGQDLDQRTRAPVPTVSSTTSRLLRRHPREFVPGTIGWVVFFAFPAVAAFSWARLIPQLDAAGNIWPPIAAFAVAAVVGMAGKLVGERFFFRWWMLSNITLRSNLLAAQLHPHDERAGHRPPSPGDAVSRMWDTNDLVNYADHWVDLACAAIFVVTATALSGRWATVPWLIAPVAIPLCVAWFLRRRVSTAATEHARLRGIWSGRVAEVCAAATTIKGFGAEAHVVAHLDELTERRQQAALEQRTLELSIFGTVFLTSEAGQRLILVGLAVAAVSDPVQIGAGVAVAEAIAMMPIAGIVACMVVQEIPMIRAKLRRMARLLPVREDFDITRPPEDLRLPPAEPLPVPTERPSRVHLDHLGVRDLSVVFADGTVALEDVNLEIERGELIIVTGPIASGKSTLLRVLAGLCPPTEGELRWDDDVIVDLSLFLRPPNCAFVAQAPKLISGTIDENVSLDHPVDVRAALTLAELDLDLGQVGGLDAIVGHRGLRLSGGQTQRLATARATAAESELLVLDDLSSALDVVTERQLWTNLRAQGKTVVATSYKRSALELADQVVVLRQGRVAAIGSLPELDQEFGHLFA
jgi:ATP-binding cassette subfamily B protein